MWGVINTFRKNEKFAKIDDVVDRIKCLSYLARAKAKACEYLRKLWWQNIVLQNALNGLLKMGYDMQLCIQTYMRWND